MSVLIQLLKAQAKLKFHPLLALENKELSQVARNNSDSQLSLCGQLRNFLMNRAHPQAQKLKLNKKPAWSVGNLQLKRQPYLEKGIILSL